MRIIAAFAAYLATLLLLAPTPVDRLDHLILRVMAAVCVGIVVYALCPEREK